jgi:hypothetical protein
MVYKVPNPASHVEHMPAQVHLCLSAQADALKQLPPDVGHVYLHVLIIVCMYVCSTGLFIAPSSLGAGL